MKHSKKIEYHYDADLGIYIKESEISLNWLLSQVLKKENLQIFSHFFPNFIPGLLMARDRSGYIR